MELPFASILIAVGIIVALSIFFHFVPFFMWLSAQVSGVRISLIQLMLMRIRNVPPGVIVPSLIEAHKAGLSNITRDNLEAHYMTGGHVQRVVHALVSANKANIDLTFEKATAIDLAGRDVFEAVQTSVNPKVIDTPPVAAVAKNGIQLIAKARVTVRANIQQLVGGAGEETILARVGEGIVSSIGSAESHEQVLENPDSISKLVLKKGLDAGTALEILSIDIADIDVGKNIGATLQMDQANADKNIAQAKGFASQLESIGCFYTDRPVEYEQLHSFTDDELTVLDAVVARVGCYSPFALRDITHSETPWKDARGDTPADEASNNPIDVSDIGAFFMQLKQDYGMKRPSDIGKYLIDMVEKV